MAVVTVDSHRDVRSSAGQHGSPPPATVAVLTTDPGALGVTGITNETSAPGARPGGIVHSTCCETAVQPGGIAPSTRRPARCPSRWRSRWSPPSLRSPRRACSCAGTPTVKLSGRACFIILSCGESTVELTVASHRVTSCGQPGSPPPRDRDRVHQRSGGGRGHRYREGDSGSSPEAGRDRAGHLLPAGGAAVGQSAEGETGGDIVGYRRGRRRRLRPLVADRQ